MGKQRVLLKDEPDATPFRRQIDAALAIEPGVAAEGDEPRSGRRSPATARSTLDLPAPEGPTSATVSAPIVSASARRKERRP